MKKVILSTILAGILASVASAADTQALTRTANKLILSQSKIILKINDIEDTLDKQSQTDSELSKKIEGVEKVVMKNKESIQVNKENIDFVTNKVETLSTQLTDVRKTAASAIVMSKETRDLLNRIETVSKDVEAKAKEVKTGTQKLESQTKGLSTNFTQINKKLVELEGIVNDHEKRISKLEKLAHDLSVQVKNNKDIEEGHYNELKEKINSMKIYYDAEIKVLKAKLEKTRPIVITKSAPATCENGDCKVDLEDESIIDNFLK